jgi:hypothetical protein
MTAWQVAASKIFLDQLEQAGAAEAGEMPAMDDGGGDLRKAAE